MEDAYRKSLWKDSDLDRLFHKLCFAELAVMQLDLCLRFVRGEMSKADGDGHEELLHDLLVTRDRIQARLDEAEVDVAEADRDYMRLRSSASRRAAAGSRPRPLAGEALSTRRNRKGATVVESAMSSAAESTWPRRAAARATPDLPTTLAGLLLLCPDLEPPPPPPPRLHRTGGERSPDLAAALAMRGDVGFPGPLPRQSPDLEERERLHRLRHDLLIRFPVNPTQAPRGRRRRRRRPTQSQRERGGGVAGPRHHTGGERSEEPRPTSASARANDDEERPATRREGSSAVVPPRPRVSVLCSSQRGTARDGAGGLREVVDRAPAPAGSAHHRPRAHALAVGGRSTASSCRSEGLAPPAASPSPSAGSLENGFKWF